MNALLYALFVSALIVDFLSTNLGLLSRYMVLLPDCVSILGVLIFAARFMVVGGNNFPHKYILFIILFMLNILIGVVVNLEKPEPIIAGLRANLKFLPFFLLPFVYKFSQEQIEKQLLFLLYIFVFQAPLALYQRLYLSRDLMTGDLVKGTLATSGQLTIVLCCTIAILMCFYLAKKISLVRFVILFCFFFIPMTINETKVTIFLLPLALIIPTIFSSDHSGIKQYIPITIIGALTGFAFISIYDYFYSQRWGYGLIDFFTMEGRTESYLYIGTDKPTGEHGEVGKVDTYVLAFNTLSKNILNLLFGLGIGNVSESSLPGFSGEFATKYSAYNVDGTALSIALWELGLFGVILYFSFIYMIYKDSRYLSHADGFSGIIAKGWSVVSIIIAIGMAYKDIIHPNMAYLFWYFSGYIVSESSRYKMNNMKSIKL